MKIIILALILIVILILLLTKRSSYDASLIIASEDVQQTFGDGSAGTSYDCIGYWQLKSDGTNYDLDDTAFNTQYCSDILYGADCYLDEILNNTVIQRFIVIQEGQNIGKSCIELANEEYTGDSTIYSDTNGIYAKIVSCNNPQCDWCTVTAICPSDEFDDIDSTTHCDRISLNAINTSSQNISINDTDHPSCTSAVSNQSQSEFCKSGTYPCTTVFEYKKGVDGISAFVYPPSDVDTECVFSATTYTITSRIDPNPVGTIDPAPSRCLNLIVDVNDVIVPAGFFYSFDTPTLNTSEQLVSHNNNQTFMSYFSPGSDRGPGIYYTRVYNSSWVWSTVKGPVLQDMIDHHVKVKCQPGYIFMKSPECLTTPSSIVQGHVQFVVTPTKYYYSNLSCFDGGCSAFNSNSVNKTHPLLYPNMLNNKLNLQKHTGTSGVCQGGTLLAYYQNPFCFFTAENTTTPYYRVFNGYNSNGTPILLNSPPVCRDYMCAPITGQTANRGQDRNWNSQACNEINESAMPAHGSCSNDHWQCTGMHFGGAGVELPTNEPSSYECPMGWAKDTTDATSNTCVYSPFTNTDGTYIEMYAQCKATQHEDFATGLCVDCPTGCLWDSLKQNCVKEQDLTTLCTS